MADMMVKITAEVLDILGTATKEMKQSRASEFILRRRSLQADDVCKEKFLKKIAGITKLDDGLKKLDKMTNEEARMANAEGLRLGYDIEKKVEGVDQKVQRVGAQVKVVEEKVNDAKRSSLLVFSPAVEYLTQSITGNELLISLRVWQSPSDPSTNHNFASHRQHKGTAEWFCRSSKVEEWKVAGSLLWIHGKRMHLFLSMTSMN
jgi:hypothetical protein